MSLALGMRVGTYEVIALLGAGGMGEVYRARDTRLKRDVALKVLPEHFTSDPDRLARFQREAEVLASLNHPHIAHIHGLEEADGVRALVLELVEGPTLADRIAQGPVPVDEALPIARQIAEALEAAHEQGIIHRDLKPANIKLQPDGTVKVLDFGLAKTMEPTSGVGPRHSSPLQDSPTLTTPAMTIQGMILGTAAYMSPEQAKGRLADKRSDIWAFGSVLYEMLTGKRAFEGEDVSDTLAAVLRGEPDWAALPQTLPSAVRTLLQRCLQRDRRRRVGDISAALFVLDEASSLSGQAPATHETHAAAVQAQIQTAIAQARKHWTRYRLLPALAALLAIGIVAVLATLRLTPEAQPAGVVRFSFETPASTVIATSGRGVLAIASDGAQVAYVANSALLVRSLAEQDARVIANDLGRGVSSPAFSPDDRSLAFFSAGERTLKRIGISGGAAVPICSLDPIFGISWHSSGILVGQGGKGIVRCAATGGTPEQLATVNEGEEAHGPQLLPDGQTLLFTVAKTSDGAARWDKAQIVVQSPGSGERKTIITGGSDARFVSTGHILYALAGVVFAVPFDPARQEVLGGPVPVIEGVRRTIANNTGIAQFVTSPNGTLLYVPGPVRTTGERALAIADRTGTLTRLNVSPGAYDHVRVSRDGSRLAIGTDDGNESIVWIYDLDGKQSMQRLTLQGKNRKPIWSPDGQRLAYQSDREGDLAIWIQRVDGSGAAERVTKPEPGMAHVPESWSPDGRHILFAASKDTDYSLWTLSVETKTAMPFGAVKSQEPIGALFSPDGNWVLYAAGQQGGAQSSNRGVFVQPFPATGAIYQVPRLALDFQPVWSAGGVEIVWVPSAASGRLAAVSLTSKAGMTFGTPTQFAARVTGSRTSGLARAYDILPDGRFVGIVNATDSDSAASGSFNAAELRVVLNWNEELKQKVPIP